MRPVLVVLAVMFLGVACGGAATSAGATPSAAAAAKAELAPSGHLRLGFPAAPPFLGNQDPASGHWKGLAITLGGALANSLGVSMVPTQYPDPLSTYQALESGKVDVILAQLQVGPGGVPVRPDGVAGSGAVVSVQHTFLVKGGSSLRTMSEVDEQGIRIGSNATDGHTPFLASHLMHAQLIKFSTDDAGLAALSSGQIDAWADGRFALTDMTSRLPGSRILDGSFLTPMFAFSTVSAHSNAVSYLDAFVAAQLASGAIKQDIATIVGKPGVFAGAAA